jgi:UDP-N-acetylmuramate dehydrogenase
LVSGPVDEAARLLRGLARRDEPVGALTTYRVGGRAALFVELEDEAGLEAVAAAIEKSGVPVLVIGKGSNLLVSDGGFAGLALALGEAFSQIHLREDSVAAGGGAAYPVLARRSAAEGLAGMEWAVGIPGSVGGAVRMNAGGHGAETKDRLVSATVADLARGDGGGRPLGPEELGLDYRASSIADSQVVLEATFSLEPGDPEEGAARIAEIVRWRRENQPGGQNAGSVFVNPPGDSAGRIVDVAGLKGLRIGSAMVSPRHANFIQADPGGSAEDVLRVIEAVRKQVADRLGIDLSTEVQLVGF